jgi:hypothetical protein
MAAHERSRRLLDVDGERSEHAPWHGLLVAAMRPPVGRAVVLSKMDETLDACPRARCRSTRTSIPALSIRVASNIWRASVCIPFPAVVFQGPGWRLEKTIYLVHGENTVVISYRMLPANRPRRVERKKTSRPAKPAANSPVGNAGAETTDSADASATNPRTVTGDTDPNDERLGKIGAKSATAAAPSTSNRVIETEVPAIDMLELRVRPLFAFRDASELALENARIQRTVGVRMMDTGGSIVRCTPYPEWEPVYLVCPDAEFIENPDWYKNVEYPQERYRGLDYREDLWSYGYYDVRLRQNHTLTIACTLHSPEKRLPGWPVEREIERRAQIMMQVPDEKPFVRRLGWPPNSSWYGVNASSCRSSPDIRGSRTRRATR